MTFKISKYLALGALAALSFTACVKNDVEDLGDRGATFVKIQEAPERPFFFDVFTDVRSLDLFSLRKDANSNQSLNTASTITLTAIPEYIDTYNDDNGTAFEVLPDSLYTIENDAFTRNGDNYTVSFPSGAFAQEFTIGLNGAKWDVSHTYALAFAVSDAAGATLTHAMDTILVMFSVKNEFDGRYTMSGTLVDAANGLLTAKSPTEVQLLTAGPLTVQMYNSGTDIGSFKNLFPIMSGADESAYGQFLPVFELDENYNVISVVNAYGQPAGNSRRAELDPSGVNKYDPATKTLKVKWFMYQPTVVAVGPRTSFDFTFTYLGPR